MDDFLIYSAEKNGSSVFKKHSFLLMYVSFEKIFGSKLY